MIDSSVDRNNEMFLTREISELVENVHTFIYSCQKSENKFLLTRNSDDSAYAILFAILSLYLIGDFTFLNKNKIIFDDIIRRNLLFSHNLLLSKSETLESDKPYLQLLCFSLSCLKILGTLEDDPLPFITENLYLEFSTSKYLEAWGSLLGRPRSGNMAMFYAIILTHKKEYLSIDTSRSLEQWIELHVKSTNKNGFWGDSKKFPYLQFQNGYHQYEIFNYFGVKGDFWSLAANHVSKLCDNHFRFAPYPGGGGCFDLDAIFFFTNKFSEKNTYEKLAINTLFSIINDQNLDGGFCESRILSYSILLRASSLFSISHLRPFNYGFKERLKYSIYLLQGKHNCITTHWTKYSRNWNESDLWDTWFRLLAIARIDVAFGLNLKKWNFPDYIGLGYKP